MYMATWAHKHLQAITYNVIVMKFQNLLTENSELWIDISQNLMQSNVT